MKGWNSGHEREGGVLSQWISSDRNEYFNNDVLDIFDDNFNRLAQGRVEGLNY